MIQTTMHALLTASLVPDVDECVYIVRSGEDVMYVGKTRDPNRRMEEHFCDTFLIFRWEDQKDVLRWAVEIRTLEECREYAPQGGQMLDIESAEVYTIQALRPFLNSHCNYNSLPVPERYKHLFEVEVGITDHLF